MADIAQEEITKQIAHIKEEWQATSEEMAAEELDVNAVPEGMTRTDFRQWKAEQAARAKQRLLELEERLQRLQLLDSKMRKLKGSSTEMGASAASAGLPGAPEIASTLTASMPPGFLNVATYNPQGALSSVSPHADLLSAGIPAAAAGSVPRPVTPGTIRKIIREEMATVSPETLLQAHHSPAGSHEANEGEHAEAAPSHHSENPQEGDPAFDRLRSLDSADLNTTAPNTAAPVRELKAPPNVQSTLEKDKADALKKALAHDAEEAEEEAHKFEKQKMDDLKRVMNPKDLEDLTPVSCNLLFGGFSRQSPIRIKAFQIYRSTMWTTLFLAVTLANTIYITIVPQFVGSSSGSRKTAGQEISRETLIQFLNYFDFVCVGFLAFEVLIGIIARGFVQSEGCWLRISGYYKLDAAALLVTASEFVLKALLISGVTLRPFRLLRVFRAITRIKMFGGVKAIIHTLKQGSGQIMTVILILFFFATGFSIFGMAIFQNSSSRRCISLELDVPECSSAFATGWAGTCNFTERAVESGTMVQPRGIEMVTGGYPHFSPCKIYYNTSAGQYDARHPLDPYGRYHSCNRDEFRAGGEVKSFCEYIDNPQNGFSHFDRVGPALITIAQLVAPDSSYDVIWRLWDAEPEVKALTFVLWIIVTCLCTFLTLGLFVAVVTGTFKKVRESNVGSAFLTKRDKQHRSNRVAAEEFRLAKQEAKEQRAISRAQSIARGETPQYDPDFDEEEDGDKALQAAAQRMKQDWRVVHGAALTIIGHAMAMAADQHDSPQTWRDFSYYMYIVCNALFVCESLIRLTAAGGFVEFWKVNFNKFEMLLVLCGLLGTFTSVKILILVPAVRVYRLMSYFPTLYALLHSAVASVHAIFNLVVFVGIVLFCFAVTGRYVFGDLMTALTRSHYGDFSHSIITTFQLLVGDSWSGVLYAAMQSQEEPHQQVFAAVFVLTWFIFGSLVANNLFVAVIIENFEVSETIQNIQKPGNISALRSLVHNSYLGLYQRTIGALTGTHKITAGGGRSAEQNREIAMEYYRQRRGDQLHLKDMMREAEEAELLGNFREGDIGNPKSAMSRVVRKAREGESLGAYHPMAHEDVPERVLYFFLPKNPVRVFFIWLGEQPAFDLIVYVTIAASCAILIITPPYDDIPDFSAPLSFSSVKLWNFVFTVIFTVEFFVRILGQGLIFTRKAYLKSGWNLIDSLVLFFAWIDVLELLTEGQMAKVVRLMRAMKPLRLMKRNQGMRVVIDALLSTLTPVMYVILFQIFTYFIFALIGLGLFGGKLKNCTVPIAAYPAGKLECSGLHSLDNGVLVQAVWSNPGGDYGWHFDTFSASMGALFRVTTFKYVSIIYTCMDITDFDLSLETDHSSYFAAFFIVYLVIGGLFCMNLFVGFIVDGFNANKGSSESEIFYSRYRRQVVTYRPLKEYFPPPKNRLSTLTRRFLATTQFQTFSALCVVTNIVFMLFDEATQLTGEPGDFGRRYSDEVTLIVQIMEIQNAIFYGELVFEVVLFTIAGSPGVFYNDMWKLFDLLVMLGSSAGYLFPQYSMIQTGTRAFRLARIVRLMKMIKPIRIILETLLNSLPQLANILLLLVLFYSMFAVLLIQTFGTTKYGVRFGPTANFGNYGVAMMTILQLVTGDEWHIMLEDLSVQEPHCIQQFDPEIDPYRYDGKYFSFGDCGSQYAIFTFVLFKLVCESMLLNLFIGMILDNFSFITDDVALQEDDQWSSGASAEQIQGCAEAFARHENYEGCLPITSMHQLMMDMQKPLGFRTWKGTATMKRRDRIQELLVRAELNVLLRESHLKSAEPPKGLRRLLGFRRNKTAESKMLTFETVMLVLLHWRKADLVPPIVKWQRHDRVEEVVLMAHALTIVMFFRELVARRKQRATRKLLQVRSKYKTWCDTDPHQRRRHVLEVEKRDRERHENEQYHSHPALCLVLPSHREKVSVEPVGEFFPEDMVEHAQALREDSESKVPKPASGLECFRQRSARSYVVLRPADPVSRELGPLIADFSRATWRGWNLVNLQQESYFEPETYNLEQVAGGSFETEPWERVDMALPNPHAGRRDDRVCSILDVQSFVIAGDKGQKFGVGAKSVIRVNLGRHRYTTDKVKSIVRKSGTRKNDMHRYEDGIIETAFMDACYEVVGYIEAEGDLGKNAADARAADALAADAAGGDKAAGAAARAETAE